MNFVLIMGCMLVLWLISIALKDVSFVDSFWPLGFVVIAASTYGMTGGGTERRQLLLVLTAIWGARLGSYLFFRWRREGPDGRYVALLQRSAGNVHIQSLVKVFLLQGIMLWLVSLPVQLGQVQLDGVAAQASDPGLLAWLGVVLALIGILFESLGDHQMAAFKADPSNHGKVMDRGLWRYTRHPNYFGDACVWWGLYLVAAETSPGVWSFIGPALLTWTLIRWSGAALLERRLLQNRPGYEDYIKRTSSFIPWLPARNKHSSDR
jgi:steroid 5-alpha reductase family enzyme